MARRDARAWLNTGQGPGVAGKGVMAACKLSVWLRDGARGGRVLAGMGCGMDDGDETREKVREGWLLWALWFG